MCALLHPSPCVSLGFTQAVHLVIVTLFDEWLFEAFDALVLDLHSPSGLLSIKSNSATLRQMTEGTQCTNNFFAFPGGK